MDLPKKYTISQAGEILGISAKTLRRWEKAGKITPKRTPTGNRFFTDEDLQNLRNLNSSKTYSVSEVAKKIGVSAKTIRRWDKAGKFSAQRNASGNRIFQEKDITLLKTKTFSPVLPKPKNYHITALGLVIMLVALGYSYYMLSFNDKFLPSPQVLGANTQDFVSGVRQKIGEFILSFLPENYKVQVITQNIPQNTQNIKFANSLTLGSDLTVQGQAILSDVNISNSLNVQGSTSLNDLSVTSLTTTGNATIGGTINGTTLTNNKLIFSGGAPSIYPSTPNSLISINSNGTGAINIGDQSKGDIYLGGGSGSGLHCVVTSSNGSFYCSGDITTSGNLKVNGGSITTGATAFNLLNETATNINFGGAAATLSIGSTSGTTTVNNNLTAMGSATLTTTLSVAGATTLSSTLNVTGGTTLSSTLGVTGTTSLNGAVNIGSVSTNDIAVNGRITTSIVPKTTASVDLGSASLKFNNLYSQTINTSGTNTSGQASFTQDPLSTAISDSSVLINPTSVTFNGAALLGLAVGGVEKARIDNNGNLTLKGNLAFSNAATVTLASSTTALNFASNLLDLDTQNSRVGIGTAGPLSKLDVNGGVAIGSYAGSTAAPSNGLIVSGTAGFGTSVPASSFDVFATQSNTSTVASYTASKTTTTVTATVGTFSAADIGRFFVWSDGTIDRITAFTNSTQVTVATSGTEGSQSATTRSANFYVNSSGLVGVQNTNPVANLDVRTTGTTNKGIAVRAVADGTDNQTGNLFEAYNGFGGVFFAVDPHSGSIKFSGTDNAWMQNFFGNSMWSYNAYARNIGGSGAVYDKSQAASEIRQDLNGKIYLSVAASGTAGNLIT